jgi:hypothetical protein
MNTMTHRLQSKKYVFHVFVRTFHVMIHGSFSWIDFTKNSLNAVKQGGQSDQEVEYLYSKCEFKFKPKYNPNT